MCHNDINIDNVLLTEDTLDIIDYEFAGYNDPGYDFGRVIAGFEYEGKAFKGIYVVTNEQTYASTLVDNYINPLNHGDVNLDDVSCGATYGAKLVRSLITAAQGYVDGIIYD